MKEDKAICVCLYVCVFICMHKHNWIFIQQAFAVSFCLENMNCDTSYIVSWEIIIYYEINGGVLEDFLNLISWSLQEFFVTAAGVASLVLECLWNFLPELLYPGSFLKHSLIDKIFWSYPLLAIGDLILWRTDRSLKIESSLWKVCISLLKSSNFSGNILCIKKLAAVWKIWKCSLHWLDIHTHTVKNNCPSETVFKSFGKIKAAG